MMWKLPIITKEINMSYVTAIHPGAVLEDEIEERGMRQSDLARHIRVLPKTINEICRGKRGISSEMAWKLSRAFGTSPQFWINLQTNWELSRVDENEFREVAELVA